KRWRRPRRRRLGGIDGTSLGASTFRRHSRRCVKPALDLELLFEVGERRPAGVWLGLVVVVRLVVQVLAADRAEAGTRGPAEDLVRQLERDRVARPGGKVELVVGEVLAL